MRIYAEFWVDLDLISNLQDILSWDNNKSYLFSISNGEGFSDGSIENSG